MSKCKCRCECCRPSDAPTYQEVIGVLEDAEFQIALRNAIVLDDASFQVYWDGTFNRGYVDNILSQRGVKNMMYHGKAVVPQSDYDREVNHATP